MTLSKIAKWHVNCFWHQVWSLLFR
jgi:hypothetical protein